MGIKTAEVFVNQGWVVPLKNLPTTWGLRLYGLSDSGIDLFSEKPPLHMGIKTFVHPWPQMRLHSEKPPHHSGIIQR